MTLKKLQYYIAKGAVISADIKKLQKEEK